MRRLGSTRLRLVVAVALAIGAVLATAAVGTARQAATPPKITVGFLQILGSSAAAQRLEADFRTAAGKLGWTVKSVDAQGDPAKMAAGVQSFVTQKVNAIVTIAVAAAAAKQALTAAKAAGIPAIAIGSVNPDPDHLYGAQIAVNDSALGAVIGQYMADVLGQGAKIVGQTFTAIDALARRDNTAAAVWKKNNITMVASHQIDFTNGVQDTIKSTVAMLRAHPDVTAVYADMDFEFVPVLQAIKQAGRSGKVKVFGYLAGPDELNALRKGGDAAGIADSPEQYASWIAADQLLAFFGMKHKIDPLAQYNIYNFPIALITPVNVPKTGAGYPWPAPAPFFVKRWTAEGFSVK